MISLFSSELTTDEVRDLSSDLISELLAEETETKDVTAIVELQVLVADGASVVTVIRTRTSGLVVFGVIVRSLRGLSEDSVGVNSKFGLCMAGQWKKRA